MPSTPRYIAAHAGPSGVPFRWDVSREEQLGRLVPTKRVHIRDLAAIRRVAAKVVARSGRADLVFVGRSAENLYDYLGGALRDVPTAPALSNLNVSLRYQDVNALGREQVDAFRSHCRALRCDPRRVLARGRVVAWVDVVASGGTFGALTGLLLRWAEEERLDVPALRQHMRFVALTKRRLEGARTWRWWQRADWVADFPRAAVRSVSMDPSRFAEWADLQPKVAPSNPAARWRTSRDPQPPTADQREALGFARSLFAIARSKDERERFGRALALQPAMRERWFRRLAGDVRRF